MAKKAGVTSWAGGAIAVAVLSVAAPAWAAPPDAGARPAEQRAWLSGGWDPVWAATAGYAREVGAIAPGLPLALQIEVTVPVRLAVSGNHALAAGVVTHWVPSAFGVSLDAQTRLAWSDDVTGSKLGWGVDVAARPGWYGERTTIALELGWRVGLATRFTHSAVVKDLFLDRYGGASAATGAQGPRDGWYGFPVQRLRAGLAAGHRLTASLALHVAGGFEHTAQEQGILANPSLGQLPFFVSAGGDWRW